MPGYVNYWYKDGNLPAHANENFKEYNIFTVQRIIVMNALISIHKVSHFPNMLPPSVCTFTPNTIPKFGDEINDCNS